MINTSKKIRIAVYALHPIMYQTPIFAALEKRIRKKHLDMELTVLYGDDLSLKQVFFEETKVYFKPDTPNLLEGHRYLFLRNLAKDSRSGFFSRINLGIFKKLIELRTTVLIVHGYESMTAWLAILGAPFLRKKIIWRGEVVPRSQQSTRKRILKKILLGFFFNRCDAVMYSCSGNKFFLTDHSVPQSKLFSIPCAVDNKFFQSEYSRYLPQRTTIRQSLDIQNDECVVLFCARFTDRKRPLDLVEAIAQNNNRKIVALFVGDGPEKEKTELLAQKKGIRAIFSGFKNQSEVGLYYAISDVATVISSHDPSPKAMNEAMNFMLPIIATDVIGTVPDLVRDNHNGFIISVGDTEKLAKNIAFLYKNPVERKKMGSRSRELVNSWNYEADVDGILEAIGFVTN